VEQNVAHAHLLLRLLLLLFLPLPTPLSPKAKTQHSAIFSLAFLKREREREERLVNCGAQGEKWEQITGRSDPSRLGAIDDIAAICLHDSGRRNAAGISPASSSLAGRTTTRAHHCTKIFSLGHFFFPATVWVLPFTPTCVATCLFFCHIRLCSYLLFLSILTSCRSPGDKGHIFISCR